jgi:hypothetical protein
MQEAISATVSSPSAAFLADAVEASALSRTPNLKSFLRSSSNANAAEAANMSFADALELSGAARWPRSSHPSTPGGTPHAPLSVGEPVATAFEASAAHGSAFVSDVPQGGGVSQGATPRASSDHACNADRHLSEAALTQAVDGGGVAAHTTSRTGHLSGPASRTTSDVMQLDLPSRSVSGNAIKKEAGGMTRAERRAKQEEQRAKKVSERGAHLRLLAAPRAPQTVLTNQFLLGCTAEMCNIVTAVSVQGAPVPLVYPASRQVQYSSFVGPFLRKWHPTHMRSCRAAAYPCAG